MKSFEKMAAEGICGRNDKYENMIGVSVNAIHSISVLKVPCIRR